MIAFVRPPFTAATSTPRRQLIGAPRMGTNAAKNVRRDQVARGHAPGKRTRPARYGCVIGRHLDLRAHGSRASASCADRTLVNGNARAGAGQQTPHGSRAPLAREEGGQKSVDGESPAYHRHWKCDAQGTSVSIFPCAIQPVPVGTHSCSTNCRQDWSIIDLEGPFCKNSLLQSRSSRARKPSAAC